MELGEHAQLVPDLGRLTANHPYDEQLHGHLMLALYRDGRQADALAAYHQLRRTLGDDLGIDPSLPLRDLPAAILRQDPALDPPLAGGHPAPRASPGGGPGPGAVAIGGAGLRWARR
jgi:DNA-binding SARP family transcriptional activator